MSSHPFTPRAARPRADLAPPAGPHVRLEQVASLLDDRLGPDVTDSPDDDPRLLVGAVFKDDGVELLLKPIAGHPIDDLLGFVAPTTWTCLGLVAGGWARELEGDPTPGVRPARGDRRRIRLTHLVDRTGHAVVILASAGSEPNVEHVPGPRNDRGQLDDACRRALRLPTAPPPPDSLGFWARVWLHDVLTDALAGKLDGADWAALVARHPATDPVADDGALLGWLHDNLERGGELLAAASTWKDLHDAAAHGRGPVAIPRELAAWMDVGMFARTLLGSFPEPDDMLLDLNVLLDADPFARLVDTIEAWGVLDGPPTPRPLR